MQDNVSKQIKKNSSTNINWAQMKNLNPQLYD